jgi:hypothetical protein
MPFVTCCWQFAIAARPAGFHLNVEHRLIGTSSGNSQCLIAAVVNDLAHKGLQKKSTYKSTLSLDKIEQERGGLKPAYWHFPRPCAVLGVRPMLKKQRGPMQHYIEHASPC